MNIEIISENFGPFENPQIIAQVHAKVDGEHILFSSSHGFGYGAETLGFSCNVKGKVENWIEVAGTTHSGMVLRPGNVTKVIRALMGEGDDSYDCYYDPEQGSLDAVAQWSEYRESLQ